MELTRGVLALGAVAALGGTAFLAVVPTDWMAERLALAEPDVAPFLVRRFAASATAGLAASSVAALRGVEPDAVALTGLAAWFGGQAVTAVAGLATGTVGGVAWLSAALDPTAATVFALAARRAAHPDAPGTSRA